MRDVIVNKSLRLLNDTYNYDKDMLERVKYGLELLYISITKTFVILLISILFKTLYETLITILFFNGLRSFAYGMHAKKSWQCFLSSTLLFVLLPYLFKFITFTVIQKIIISFILIVSNILYAPSDTHKRPLVNKKHRKQLKLKCLLISLLYILIIFICKNQILNNMIILSMVIEMFIINPFIYKIFNMPYNNYIAYSPK